jgi:beta-glucosidase
MTKRSLLFCLSFAIFLFTVTTTKAQQTVPAYRNMSLPIDARVDSLISKLTLEEKISLLGYQSKAVPRLGIPAYNWWNEALHGVARAGEATVYPQAIGMAASFNDDLLRQVASCISTEARAKYNIAIAKDQRIQYMGLTFWSPNINIFRDPRWGRGQETYGEDPYLTGRMGSAFVRGMQGNDPNHLKVAACAKHYAVHSGPEGVRDYFNAIVDEKDLRETYLQAFHQLVDSGVESVMGAYNRVNGEPCTINKHLIGILRNEWGFKGHFLTDCGALDDIWRTHKVLSSPVDVAAAAIKAGVNLDCSTLLQNDAMQAVKQGLLTEKEINASLHMLLRTQFKLGFYDDPSTSPYNNYGVDSVRSAYHVELARKIAEQGMVLLKNTNNVLPLSKAKVQSIMVTGPNSFNADVLLGNYSGLSSRMVTFTEGITGAAGPGIRVQYAMGSDFVDSTRFNGLYQAGESDVTIAVIGLSPTMEGEAGDAFLSKNSADKADLNFPAVNLKFMQKLRAATKKPIIAVVTGGSALDIASIEPYADAIIIAWYPGEQGGNALADIVFGKVSPSGHLPITYYKSVNDLPDYKDYSMKGRTYRYFTGQVEYPFGYGLSYTSFSYDWVNQPKTTYKSENEKLSCTIKVNNTGAMDGDEVVQAYIIYPNLERMPLKELKGFKRVTVAKGQNQQVNIDIPMSALRKWDLKENKWKLYKGKYSVVLGDNSMDKKLAADFTVK